MKRIINILLVLMILLISTACGNTSDGEDNINLGGDKKELNNVVFAEVKEGEKIDKEFERVVNRFSIDFFKNAKDGNNLVTSPLSMLIALQMLRHACNGNSKAELDNIIQMNSDDFDSNIMFLLNHKSEFYDDAIKRLISNSLWLNNQLNVNINSNYADLLTKRYKSSIKELAFNDEGKKEINDWIENSTEGVIKDFIKEIDADTIFYLLNTIYFQDFWMDYYLGGGERSTEEDLFTNYDGKRIIVDMMNANQWDDYYRGNNFLAFKDHNLISGNVIIIVPNVGEDINNVIDSLSPEILNDMYDFSSSNWRFADITAGWPMFKYDDEIDAKRILENMGVKEIFDEEKADLSNGVVSNKGNIYVKNVKQKVDIDVNGKGITAAAVTSVEGGLGAAGNAPEEKITIMADRPFIYLIFDDFYDNKDYSQSFVTYFMGAVYQLEGQEAGYDLGNEVGEFKIGEYKLDATMKVRTAPDYNADEVEVYKIPYEYRGKDDRARIAKGTRVEILKIKRNDDNSYWGKVADGAWICMKDKDGTYYVVK